MKKSIYRIYNEKVGAYGEPFTLCEKHFRIWRKKTPHLIVEEMAKNSNYKCEDCIEDLSDSAAKGSE